MNEKVVNDLGCKMDKLKVFIGSSTEGLKIAEAVNAYLKRQIEVTHWKDDIFLPGEFPLETLEEQLRHHSFAILVASPDDELIKRGESFQAMRDNILFEYGLFTGLLGRKRTFLLKPEKGKISIPSDVLGIITATYDEGLLKKSTPDFNTMIEEPCKLIKKAIDKQWNIILEERIRLQSLAQTSEIGLTLKRLYSMSSQLREVITTLDGEEILHAASDKYAFEKLKATLIEKVKERELSIQEDAISIGVEKEISNLSNEVIDAIRKLPFPDELNFDTSIEGQAWKKKAKGVAKRALNRLAELQNPTKEFIESGEEELKTRLLGLQKRYSFWWNDHHKLIQDATNKLQEGIFNAAIKLGLSSSGSYK